MGRKAIRNCRRVHGCRYAFRSGVRMYQFLPLALLLGACTQGATMIVENHAPAAITNAVIQVTEAQYTIDRLEPREARILEARPRGESAVAVSYTYEGVRVTAPKQGYFESSSSYVVRITLDGRSARVVTRLRGSYSTTSRNFVPRAVLLR